MGEGCVLPSAISCTPWLCTKFSRSSLIVLTDSRSYSNQGMWFVVDQSQTSDRGGRSVDSCKKTASLIASLVERKGRNNGSFG
jgi:hypothetical protein